MTLSCTLILLLDGRIISPLLKFVYLLAIDNFGQHFMVQF